MTFKRTLFLLTLSGCLAAAGAVMGEQVRFAPERYDGYARIKMIWPESLAEQPVSVEAAVENQVLIVHFNRPVEGDLAPVLETLGAEAALARLDPDGRTLRIALRQDARAHVSRSYNVTAIDLLPPDAESDPPDVVSPREQAEIEAAARAAAAPPPPPPAPAPPLDVTLTRATAPTMDRLVLEWPQTVPYTVEKQDGITRIVFDRDGDIDLASLHADMPSRLASIAADHANGKLTLTFQPGDGSLLRVNDDGSTVTFDLVDSDTGETGTLAALEAFEQAAMAMQADAGAGADGGDGESPSGPEGDGPVPLTDQAEQQAEAPAAAPEIVEPEPVETAEAPQADEGGAEDIAAGDPSKDLALTAAAPDSSAARPDPVPASGIVAARGAERGGDLQIAFEWAAPVEAAAFRRGRNIWIVFAAEAELNMDEILRGHRRHVSALQTVKGDGYSAVRIAAPPSTQIEARPDEEGSEWRFVLADKRESPPAPVYLSRQTGAAAPGRLLAGLAGGGPVFELTDPDAGDRLVVVTAPPPVRGLLTRHELVDVTLPPTAHGLAVIPVADDVVVHAGEEAVSMERPAGLALSPAEGETPGAALALASPAFVDFETWKGEHPFYDTMAALERQAAAAGNARANMNFARFLLAYEMGPEALGALELALEREPQLENDAHFLAMRGVANYLTGHFDAAERDFSDTSLMRDHSADLWRAMLAIEDEDWAGARRAFESGRTAFYNFTPEWRARFRAGYARAALKLNDLDAAEAQLDLASAENPEPALQRRLELIDAALHEARGEYDEAGAIYERLSISGDVQVEAKAILANARMALEQGKASEAEAIETLEQLRYRWRGDDVELETLRTLGKLYVENGEYGKGLGVMKSGLARFPDRPVSRRLSMDMAAIFEDLFLKGEADKLDPVEALALYYEFSELTPIGADGDRMIRRLAERLVEFDLLSKAAELLQHQVDNRLREPVARAQVASDLALIYLMNRRPEAALRTLRATRQTRLPGDLLQERRLIEARALAELGALDNALELLAGDRTLEAARLRADIAWKTRNWAMAGQRLEELLGGLMASDPSALTEEQEAAVLRAAVAYALADEDAKLDALNARYGDLMAKTGSAGAFAAITGDVETSGMRLSEIARSVSDTSDLEAFLDSRRSQLEDGGADIDYEDSVQAEQVAANGEG